jgi:hypothetical protein
MEHPVPGMLRTETGTFIVMARYFFDFRDGETFLEDQMGLDFPSLEAVSVEAAAGLMEHACDVVPGSDRREMAVEVRTDAGHVLTTKMVFEVKFLKPETQEAATGLKASGAKITTRH